MDIREIAEGCIEYWRKVEWSEAIRRYYAGDAVNVEPVDWQGLPSEVTGKEAILKKYEWVPEALEEHSAHIDGPYFGANNRFAVRIQVDAITKADGQQRKIEEIGLYTVRDGKVVREEFFYGDAEVSMFQDLNQLTR